MNREIRMGNVKLIYEKSISKLTSICIGLEAGANSEDDILGVAHATEHMLYKGTKNRSEKMINKELSNIFAFQNAMTNYPYVIYYGTLLNEDFEKGIELFSDILLNPLLDENDFLEEKQVIIEELAQWDEELEQFCEDRLYYNAFSNRRLKYPIIGTERSLEDLTINDIRDFYRENYLVSDMTITIVTSLELEYITKIIKKNFSGLMGNHKKVVKVNTEGNKPGVFIDYRGGLKTSKIEVVFDLLGLDEMEIKALNIINVILADGVNSLLYNKLRTKSALIYDIIPEIAYEKGIELYKLTLSTSNENLDRVLDEINETINGLKEYLVGLSSDEIMNAIKRFKLKELFKQEKGIILAKEITTYDVMFKDFNRYKRLTENLDSVTKEIVIDVSKKIFKDLSIQIIRGDKYEE